MSDASNDETDPLIAALYLLKGQAQSPIHCEAAGRAIHEIERLRQYEPLKGGTPLPEFLLRQENDRLRAALEQIESYPSTAKHVSDIRTWLSMQEIAARALAGTGHETGPAQPIPCWCPYCREPHGVNKRETDPWNRQEKETRQPTVSATQPEK